MKRVDQGEMITLEELEHCLALAAYFVVVDGAVMVPIFERIEREVETMRAGQDAVGRARRMIENYKVVGGVKAIR